MKTISLIFAFLVFALSSPAYARAPEQLINYPAIPVAASSGKALNADQVCQIVREVAEQKSWRVEVQPEGKLVATLSWKSDKHAIVIEVSCAAASYSVAYKDSINMNFATRDGQMVIHPYYNRFVKEVNDSVRVRLLTL